MDFFAFLGCQVPFQHEIFHFVLIDKKFQILCKNLIFRLLSRRQRDKISAEVITMTIGEKMRYYREQLEMSQGDVAQLLRCSRPTYSYYEIGRTQPDLARLWEISRILHVSNDLLLNPAFDPEIDRQRRYYARLRKKKPSGDDRKNPDE